MTFERITVEPDQMGGVACVRGLRIPVATVVGMVADGMSVEEILDALPDLEAPDVHEALHYAAGPLYTGALMAYSKGLIGPAPRRAVHRDASLDVTEPDRAGELRSVALRQG